MGWLQPGQLVRRPRTGRHSTSPSRSLIEANFRTYAEYDGRAVAGVFDGGFGALKYAKYYGHFASASSHLTGSLRRDPLGLVVH